MSKSNRYLAAILFVAASSLSLGAVSANADTIVVRPPIVIEKEVPPPPPPPPTDCSKTTVKTEDDNGTTVSKTVSCPNPDAPPSDN